MGRVALVREPVVSLLIAPSEQCELVDEALHGMEVEILETMPNDWAYIRTHYRYEAYCKLEHLVTDDALLAGWEELPKKVVGKAQADVLSGPDFRRWRVSSLPRGAVIAATGGTDESGWVGVCLCDGRSGFLRSGYLSEPVAVWREMEESELRRRLVAAALSYLGTPYRWGGNPPQGIDCSGLCSMAYLLNGIAIYRDADIREGFCMREIPVEDAKAGDLIFFKGHAAMYLGDGRIIHSTARDGSDGVALSSLDPRDEDYRPDLIPLIRFAGTIF